MSLSFGTPVSHKMTLTNDSYLILIGTKNFTERYRRDKKGWLKVSSRGRKFRMTAEQVLNHLLPAVAGVKPGIIIKVKYRPEVGKQSGSKRRTPNGRRKRTEQKATRNKR
jgi:hypothetical protein